MSTRTFVVNLLLLGVPSWLAARRKARAEAEAARIREQLAALAARTAARVRSYPVRHLSQAELARLPKGAGLNLYTCPLGTCFVCAPHPHLPREIVVVGEVVAGDQLLCDQWGAGLSLPDRGINRYRAEVVA